jgi:hypothetical protein
MGFYDDFRRDCAAQGLLAKNSSLRILREATVLRAQNVMDYYADTIPDAEAYNKQLGILTPPWPILWLEVGAPTSGKLRMPSRVMDWPQFGFARAGALVRTEERPLDTSDVRWRLHFTFLFDCPVVESPPGRDWLHYPFTTGQLDLKDDGCTLNQRVGYHDDHLSMSSESMRMLVTWNRTILADVMLLAFSFCNCRNVALPETVPVRRTPTKREQKKKITPLVDHRFHTILIEPFKTKFARDASEQPANASTSETSPSAQALHIVRGHFHTYTPERPLFGKPDLYGQFWIPQHARGAADSGTINADYEIRLDESQRERGE